MTENQAVKIVTQQVLESVLRGLLNRAEEIALILPELRNRHTDVCESNTGDAMIGMLPCNCKLPHLLELLS